MTYMILHALAPIFVIMLLGFYAGKSKRVDNKNVALLNVFVMDFSLPAALFSATVKTPWSGIVQQWPLIVVLVLSMWFGWFLLYTLATRLFHQSAQDAAVLTLTVSLPNYAALGLPVLGSVLGAGATTSLSVAVSIACGSVLLTPFCLLILEREKARAAGDDRQAGIGMLPLLMWRAVTKPIVWGPVLGVAISALGITFPPGVLMAIQPLGLAATAAALFLTGVILSARTLRINGAVILGCLTRLLIQPLVAWGGVLLLGLHGQIAIAAVLMSALSAGFFGVVFGNRFGVQSADAEAVLLLTSLLCILSLPLFIMMTSGI